MIHKVFSVFDVKVGAYLPPFIAQNELAAIRSFTDCVRDDTHAFGRNPHDYSLFFLGDWNDEDAEYCLETRQCIITGVECLPHSTVTDAGLFEVNTGPDPDSVSGYERYEELKRISKERALTIDELRDLKTLNPGAISKG